MFKTVGLVARYDKKEALELTCDLAGHLAEKGLDVFIEDSLVGKLAAKAKFVALSEMDTDFVITIGGDGTILRAAINLGKPDTPILTVNMGVRGFLTEVEPKFAFEAVDRILMGDYRVEKSAKMAVSVGKETLPDALNDVVISTGEPSNILCAQICKNDKPILKCQADGLIIATQTGSTGYSLSAGGPVLDQEINSFVLTPICSLTVFHSLVFPAESTLTVTVIRPEKMLVLIDGNFRKHVSTQELTVKVTKSKNSTAFIRFESDFYDRLRNMLLFKGTE